MCIYRFGLCALLFLAVGLTVDAGAWPRFRGPNGAGVAEAQNIPIEFDADKNVLWKTPIPPGNSSPVIWDRHIFLQSTSKDGAERMLLCLDAATGKIRWRRSFPGVNVKLPQKYSSLAMASPAALAQRIGAAASQRYE